jgi:DNA-binding NarL/FixJ family response regulator
MVDSTHPQVVLMDIGLPGDSGLEAARQIAIRYPETTFRNCGRDMVEKLG